jgi:hypothetical protein
MSKVGKAWEAIGGRKFLALVLACGVYVWKGSFDFNLALIFAAYMGANILARFVDGKNVKREYDLNGGRNGRDR